MTSYNRINGVYAPNSYDICTKALRNEWGFDGVVMTDWFSTNKGQAINALAMKAGNDLIMPGGSYHKKELLKGVQAGVCTEEDLRRCCANVVKSVFDSATQKEYIGYKYTPASKRCRGVLFFDKKQGFPKKALFCVVSVNPEIRN